MSPQKAFSLVCLGDSTTAGTPGFFSPRERPPDGQGNPESQYAYWIQQRHPEWKVFNRGVRGQRTDQMLRRFNWDVPPHQPDCVVILGGVNDIHQGREISVIQENLNKLYTLALEQKAKVLACTILPLNLFEAAQKENILTMNAWIQDNAREKGLGFCDTYQALEDPAHPGNLRATPDDIHPDAAEYRRMGGVICDAIERLIL